MYFHGMRRKQLQELCKKHGIRANLKNPEMADRLASIFKENEESISKQQSSSEDSGEKTSEMDNPVEEKKTKKVKFSPESEIFEFTRSVKRRWGRRDRVEGKVQTQDVLEGGKVTRRSKRNADKANIEDGDLGIERNEAQTREQAKATEIQTSRSTRDGLEVQKVLRKSKRIASTDGAVEINVKDPDMAGGILVVEQQSNMSSQRGLEEGKAIRRSKRFAGKDSTKGGSLGISVYELQLEDMTRVTEKHPMRSTQDVIEARKIKRRLKRNAAKNDTEDGDLRVEGNEARTREETKATETQPSRPTPDGLEVQKVLRKSKWTASSDGFVGVNVKEPYMAGQILVMEQQSSMFTQSGREEGKALRRSKRFAGKDSTKGGCLGFNINEPQLEGETCVTEKQLMTSVQVGSEVAIYSSRSKNCIVNDNMQDKAGQININESHKADGNLLIKNQNGLNVGKGSRRSKRIEAKDGAQGGALGIHVSELCNDSFKEGNVLVQTKCIAADDDAQGGVPEININKQHVEAEIKVTQKQHKSSTEDGLELGKFLRQSKRLAVNDDEQCGALGINLEEQNMKGVLQATNKQSRSSIHIGTEVRRILRRSKRFTVNDDEQGRTSGIYVKGTNIKSEAQVPEKQPRRCARNVSKQNSREGSKAVGENPIVAKQNDIVIPVERLPTKAAGKMKQKRSRIQRVDQEVVLIKSILALEDIPTEYASLEPEAVEKCDDIKSSCSELIVKISSMKRKVSKRKGVNKKRGGLVEVTSSFPEAKTISCVLGENILDPPVEKLVKVSDCPEFKDLASGCKTEQNEDKHVQDSCIQAETNEDRVEALSLSQFSMEELPLRAKSETPYGSSVSGNFCSSCYGDTKAGEQTEAKTCTTCSGTIESLFEETITKTASTPVGESMETKVDLPNDHVVAKDIDPKLMTEKPVEIKKGTVSALESDLSEQSDRKEAAEDITEKLSSESINRSPGHLKEIYLNPEDGKDVLEREIQAESLPEVVVEELQDRLRGKTSYENTACDENSCGNNSRRSSAQKLTELKVGHDTHDSKILLSEETTIPNTYTSEEERTGNEEEVVDVTFTEEYTDANVDSESLTKKSVVGQSDIEVVKENPGSALKVDHVGHGKHDDVAPKVEDQETTSSTKAICKGIEISRERIVGTTIDYHARGKRSILEMEEADSLQDNDVGSLASKKIHDAKLPVNVSRTMEIVTNEDVLTKSFSGRKEEGSGNREQAEVSSWGQRKAVLKLEETKFSNKEPEVITSTSLGCLRFGDEKASEPVEENNSNASSPQLMTDNASVLVIGKELDISKDGGQNEESDVHETKEAVLDFSCTVAVDGKMGFQNSGNSSDTVKRTPASSDAFPEGDKSKPVNTAIDCPNKDLEEMAFKKRENSSAEFRDESEMIFRTSERNLMLGDELDEAGKISRAESVTDYNVDATALEANTMIIDEVDQQKAEKMVVYVNNHSYVAFKGSDKHDGLAAITQESADSASHKSNSCYFFPRDVLTQISPVMSSNTSLDKPMAECVSNDSKEAEQSPTCNMEMLADEDAFSKTMSNKAEALETGQTLAYASPMVPGSAVPDHEHDLAVTDEIVAYWGKSDDSSVETRDSNLQLEKPEFCHKVMKQGVRSPRKIASPASGKPADPVEEDNFVDEMEIYNIKKSSQNGDVQDHAHENKNIKVEDACRVTMDKKMGSEDITSISQVVKVPISLVTFSEGDQTEIMHIDVNSTHANRKEMIIEDTVILSLKQSQNEGTRFYDKSPIFTIPEKNLMLGVNELREAGKKGQVFRDEAVTGYHDDAAELKANAMVIGDVDEQKTQDLVGKQDHHTNLFSEGSYKHDKVSAKFPDESPIFTTQERILMSGDIESDEVGKKGWIFDGEAVTEGHDDNIELPNAMIIGEVDEQKTQEMVGNQDHHSNLVSEGSDKHDKVSTNFRDESPIFADPERNLILGEKELDEAGKKGILGGEAVTGSHDYAIELKANATIRGEIDEQKFEELVGKEDHDSNLVLEGSEEFYNVSAINPENADSESNKFDSSHSRSPRISSPMFILAKDIMVVGSVEALLDTPECNTSDSKETEHSPTPVVQNKCGNDGPIMENWPCSHNLNVGEKAANVQTMNPDSPVEGCVACNDTEETSKECLEPTVEVDDQTSEVITEVERTTLISSYSPAFVADKVADKDDKVGMATNLTIDPTNSEINTDNVSMAPVLATCSPVHHLNEEEEACDINNHRNMHAVDTDCNSSCTAKLKLGDSVVAGNIGSNNDDDVDGDVRMKPLSQWKSLIVYGSENKSFEQMKLSAGDFSNKPVVVSTCFLVNPLSSPSVSEECEPLVHSQDLIMDAGEKLNGDEDKGNSESYELIEEVKMRDNCEEDKTPVKHVQKIEDVQKLSLIVGEDIYDKDSESKMQMNSGSHCAFVQTDVLVEKKEEGENVETDSENIFGKTAENYWHEFFDSEGIAPTASGKSPATFASQCEPHGSIPFDRVTSSVEPTLLPDNNQQDEEMVTESPRKIPEDQLDGSPKYSNKDPNMDAPQERNYTFEKQSNFSTMRTDSRKPNRTQVKPKRHDMKENAPRTKIEQILNVTAPRTSTRRPLQDLRKN